MPRRHAIQLVLGLLPGTQSGQQVMTEHKYSFLGDSLGRVAVRLIFMSIIVGIILSALNLHPFEIFSWFGEIWQSIYDMGFDAIHVALEYFVLGAMIVIPVWLILRLLSIKGRR